MKMENTVNLNQFEKYLEKRVRPGTVGIYMSGVRRFLAVVNGGRATPKTAQAYIDRLTDDGLSPSTINTRAHGIMRWFRWNGLEIHLDCPTITMKEPDYLSMAEVAKVVSVCHTQFERTMVIVLFDTAIRISEMLGLEVDDVDRERKIVTVTRKGGRREDVNISDRALHELEHWMDIRPYKVNLVFMGMSYHDAWTAVKKLGRRAGVITRPHIFRHSRAIQMLLNGATLHDVQVHLGHSNISTTANIYGRFKAVDVRSRIPEWSLEEANA